MNRKKRKVNMEPSERRFDVKCSQEKEAVKMCSKPQCKVPALMCGENKCQCKVSHKQCSLVSELDNLKYLFGQKS